MNPNPIASYIGDRLKEPSTWAGIATFLIGMKIIPNDPSLTEGITTVGVLAGGVLAALFPEGASKS